MVGDRGGSESLSRVEGERWSGPRPEYPFALDEMFNSGDCTEGRIVFSAEKGAHVSTIRYGNQDGDTAAWSVP